MAAFLPVVSRPWSVHVPKYTLPLAFISASMLSVACRACTAGGEGTTTAAARGATSRSMRLDFILSKGEGWRELISDVEQQQQQQ